MTLGLINKYRLSLSPALAGLETRACICFKLSTFAGLAHQSSREECYVCLYQDDTLDKNTLVFF